MSIKNTFLSFLLVFGILFTVLFGKNVFAMVKIGVLPYKVISMHYKKYSYIKKSIPFLLSSNLASKNISIARARDIKNFINKNRFTSFSTKNLIKNCGPF